MGKTCNLEVHRFAQPISDLDSADYSILRDPLFHRYALGFHPPCALFGKYEKHRERFKRDLQLSFHLDQCTRKDEELRAACQGIAGSSNYAAPSILRMGGIEI